MRRFGPLLPALLLACASSQSRCGHDPQTTTTGATTESATSGSATSGSASGGSAGEIEDAAVAAIDGELRATLSAVYGQAKRASWRSAAGPSGTAFTIEYDLARAHARADLAALQSGLTSRGFQIDRALDEESSSTIFAERSGSPLSVLVEVGAAKLTASIERLTP